MGAASASTGTRTHAAIAPLVGSKRSISTGSAAPVASTNPISPASRPTRSASATSANSIGKSCSSLPTCVAWIEICLANPGAASTVPGPTADGPVKPHPASVSTAAARMPPS